MINDLRRSTPINPLRSPLNRSAHQLSYVAHALVSSMLTLTLCQMSYAQPPEGVTSTQERSNTRELLLDAPPLHHPVSDSDLPQRSSVKPAPLDAPEREAKTKNETAAPLKVTIYTPHVSSSGSSNPVVISFSAPLTSIASVGQAPRDVRLSIAPHIAGAWRWQSDRSLEFKPEGSWPLSSEFEVTIRGPLRGVSGAEVSADFVARKRFETRRNRPVYSVTLCEPAQCKRDQRQHLGHLTAKSRIKACFYQALPDQVPLSIFKLAVLEGDQPKGILKLAFDEALKRPERCVYLKVDDQIPPYRAFKLEVTAGAPSAHGPLLSTHVEDYLLNSVERLKLNSVSSGRETLSVSFNHLIPQERLTRGVVMLPSGLDPNQLSGDERAQRNLLTFDEEGSRYSESYYRTRYNARFKHTLGLTEDASVWLRVDALKSNVGEALDRESVLRYHATSISVDVSTAAKLAQLDSGQPWVKANDVHVNLGRARADHLAKLITVEQLNQPTESAFNYGMDTLCLRWQGLKPDELARLDALNLSKLNAPLLTAAPDVCFDTHDPSYTSRYQSVPLTPYRFAVRGPESSWSFTQPQHQSQQIQGSAGTRRGASTRGATSAVSPRRAYSGARQVQRSKVNCAKASDPCAPVSSVKIKDWLSGVPTVKSGHGSHIYLLTQRWSWEPRSGYHIRAPYSSTRAKSSPRYYSTRRSIVQATRLGMVAKIERRRGEVWVWDMLSHSELKGALISVYRAGGDRVASARADQHGVARFKLPEPIKDHESYYLFAEYQGDYAFVTTYQTHLASNQSSHWGWYGSNLARPGLHFTDSGRGMIWTERGIYKPGEELYVGGTVAVANGRGVTPLGGASCVLSLRDPHYTTLLERPLQTSPLGGVSMRLELPEDAKLGSYAVELNCKADSESYRWQSQTRVAHFRAPVFALDAKVERAAVVSGDPISASLRGRYLYGAPMVGRDWAANLTMSVTHFRPRGVTRYHRDGDPEGAALGELNLSDFSYEFARWRRIWWDDESAVEVKSSLASHYPKLSLDDQAKLTRSDAEGTLNTEGLAALTESVKLTSRSPQTLSVNWRVTDHDQQEMSATSQVTVHPTSGYVGLRSPRGSYTHIDDPNELEVIWVDALTARPRADKRVHLDLYAVEWRDVSIKDEVGRDEIVSQQRLIALGSCQVTTTDRPERCQVDTRQAGQLLWVARAQDDAGRESYSVFDTFRYGGSGASWMRRSGDGLSLRLTRDELEVGEEIGVLIENPFPSAQAWLTVEREGILLSRRLTIGTSDMIKIKVTEEMAPNAKIKVTLIRPRLTLPYEGQPTLHRDWLFPRDLAERPEEERAAMLTADLGRPLELYGEAPIKVKTTRQRLKVSVEPDSPEKRPGDSIKVKVKLRDFSGAPVSGEVFVWAVNEGVTRLTGYTPPNLVDALYEPRALQVRTFSHLSHLATHRTLGDKGRPVVGGGGDEDEGGSLASMSERGLFKTTPLFVGSAIVDERGEVEVSGQLPDDLTTFKLFAVGVSQRTSRSSLDSSSLSHLRSGAGDSQVTVNLPLMVRPATPRALTLGDRVELGAVVSSLIAEPTKLRVRFEVSGGARPLADQEVEVSLDPRGDRVVYLPYEVNSLEPVTVRVSIHSESRREDASRLTIPVNPPALPEHFAQHGELSVSQPSASDPNANPQQSSGAQRALIDLRSPQDDSAALSTAHVAGQPSELSVELGTSVMTMMLGEMRGLVEYPYGCLEQRSSRALPFALSSSFDGMLKLKQKLSTWSSNSGGDASARTPEAVINAHLKAMAKMQRSSGGLAYWPNASSRVHTWASAYALIVLHEIQRAGYEVTAVNLKSLAQFLRRARYSSKRAYNTYQVSASEGSLIAFALAEYDQPHTGLEEQLVADFKTLPFNARALLAATLGGRINAPSTGARHMIAEELLRGVLERFSFDGDRLTLTGDDALEWSYFDSHNRRMALTLMALLRVAPQDDQALPLLRALALNIKGEVNLNTQSAAFKLLALRDYVKVRERLDPKLNVALNLITGPKRRTPWRAESLERRGQTVSVSRSLNIEEPQKEPQKEPQEPTSSSQAELPTARGLEVVAQGQGRVYYSARLKRYPSRVRQAPLNRGYELERSYHLKMPASADAALTSEILKLEAEERDEEHDKARDEELERILPRSHSFEAGDLIEVRLALTVTSVGHYIVLNDPLPAGLEIIDPSLKGAVADQLQRSNNDRWSGFDHVELRDDRVLLFADKLKPGTYRFSYLARATQAGRFIRPAAIASEMYQPERAGQSDGGLLWIRPRAAR